MIGEHFGHVFDKPLRKAACIIPFSPNSITIAGFLVTAAASGIIPWNLPLGGAMIMIGGMFDVLDGVVARAQGKETRFGAFLDSLLDRVSDGLIMCGIAGHYYLHGQVTGMVLSLAALMAAYLVSYARARAEGLGISCSVGIMERPERIVLLAAGALTGLLIPALWLLAALTCLTALQRLRCVWRAASGL